MNISDEAVEAATGAIVDRAYGQELPEDPEDLARAALEAAAPHLMAQAWDEGAKAGADYEYRTALAFERCTLEELTPVTNPYRIQA